RDWEMTHQNECNLSAGTIEEILRNRLEAVREMVWVLFNSVTQAERPSTCKPENTNAAHTRKVIPTGINRYFGGCSTQLPPHLVIHRGLEPRTH
ncbi:MAG TPA: hypothetical protein PKZ26_10040, partial [Anaerolineaceae bacterium]|nr:hypothetical protein [Anaerolineaceae bacterium]